MVLDDRPIFLVGFMGSGKSTLGRCLADRLNWEFLDTDTMVEEAAGCGIERIFRDHGEAGFRRIESEVVGALHGMRKTVVATGGGLFLAFENRRRLKVHGRTLWLDVPIEACIERVEKGPGRPLWHPGDRVGFRALFERRRATYALADSCLRVAGESADELVGHIMAVFI